GETLTLCDNIMALAVSHQEAGNNFSAATGGFADAELFNLNNFSMAPPLVLPEKIADVSHFDLCFSRLSETHKKGIYKQSTCAEFLNNFSKFTFILGCQDADISLIINHVNW